MKFIDLTGQRFGRLSVLYREDFIKKDGKKETAYICKCDCGNQTKVLAYNLKNGHTLSCGCQSLENRVKARTTHHRTGTRLYRIWSGMKRRCNIPESEHYDCYGGRGIKVCDEWRTFEPFYEWALSSGYNELLTLDRVNNNGNYEPSNCRWTTPREQSNNTRRNRHITYKGETKTASQWSRAFNLESSTFLYRLKAGWTMEEIETSPVRRSANGHYTQGISTRPLR